MKFSPRFSAEKMGRAVSGADRLIERIPRRTRETIKSLYIFLVFVLTVAGAVFGVMKGKESAEITSAPIIQKTNDVFEIDIKREREGGRFNETLDSALIHEMKRIDPSKIAFPSRANLEPEIDGGVIEPKEKEKAREASEMAAPELVLEGEYSERPRIQSDVRPLERRVSPSIEENAVIKSERKDSPPLREEGEGVREKQDAGIKPPVERRRAPRGEDIRGPRILQHEEGVIGR